MSRYDLTEEEAQLVIGAIPLQALPSAKSYTLDDLQRLAEEYASEIHGSDHALTPRLVLSIFIEWARKREREMGDGR